MNRGILAYKELSLSLKSETITKDKIYIKDRERKSRIRNRELSRFVTFSEYQAFS